MLQMLLIMLMTVEGGDRVLGVRCCVTGSVRAVDVGMWHVDVGTAATGCTCTACSVPIVLVIAGGRSVINVRCICVLM